jgi:putative component of membrane protein insertase Oxa1/YidC/SpoIIIJ protein YidD
VSEFLRHNGSRETIIDEYINVGDRLGELFIDNEILSHCSTEHLDRLLSMAGAKGRWDAVGRVLRFGGSHNMQVGAFVEASRQDRIHELKWELISRCSQALLESVVDVLVTNGFLTAVDKVLERGISEERQRWVIEIASQRADDVGFQCFVLPHCSTHQRETVLEYLVPRGMWRSVGNILETGVSTKVHNRVIQETSRRAEDADFSNYIIPHSSAGQLESALGRLILSRMWRSVGKTLERGVSDQQHRWAIGETSRTADDEDFRDHILPYCSRDHLEYVVKSLVIRGRWLSVVRILERGISNTEHSWVIHEASLLLADDLKFTSFILPHCRAQERDYVLRQLVPRNMWRSVSTLLVSGVEEQRHKWAVAEASKNAENRMFSDYILPFCKDFQLESVLRTLVGRGLWMSVDQALVRRVSDINHTFAVTEASKRSSDREMLDYILPHCSRTHIENMLSELTMRRLWLSVDKALERVESLRLALHQGRWDVIHQANLQLAWEQVRRELFRAVVEQRR